MTMGYILVVSLTVKILKQAEYYKLMSQKITAVSWNTPRHICS